jgi:hypothetical protein
MVALPETETQIDEFLSAFEECRLPKERWTHAAHILTGACYVHVLGQAAAIDRMRVCVKRYNVAVGGKNTETSGYHETITIAWIKLLDRLRRESGAIGRADFARVAVERFEGDRQIFERFYAFDLVQSAEARRRWVPPTLSPLD